MSKICTSLKQSKKLLELGLSPDTADMCYRPIMDIDSMSNTGFLEIPDCYPFSEVKNCKVQYLPAWSLSALLDLTPDIIGDYILRLDKVDGDYYIWYDEIGKGWSDDMPHPSSNNFIDVAYENLVLLLENKKI